MTNSILGFKWLIKFFLLFILRKIQFRNLSIVPAEKSFCWGFCTTVRRTDQSSGHDHVLDKLKDYKMNYTPLLQVLCELAQSEKFSQSKQHFSTMCIPMWCFSINSSAEIIMKSNLPLVDSWYEAVATSPCKNLLSISLIHMLSISLNAYKRGKTKCGNICGSYYLIFSTPAHGVSWIFKAFPK